MSNIDWSNAPEGATHWDLGMNSRVAGWMKLDDGIWYWWPVKDAKCDMKWHSSLNQHLIDIQHFIARPCDWTGEGLPTAGTKCEFEMALAGWVPATITAVTDISIVFTRPLFKDRTGLDHENLKEEILPHHALRRFRPIRTPEQIAAEERDAAIKEIYDTITGPGDMHAAARRAYDNGYRKVTP